MVYGIRAEGQNGLITENKFSTANLGIYLDIIQVLQVYKNIVLMLGQG